MKEININQEHRAEIPKKKKNQVAINKKSDSKNEAICYLSKKFPRFMFLQHSSKII